MTDDPWNPEALRASLHAYPPYAGAGVLVTEASGTHAPLPYRLQLLSAGVIEVRSYLSQPPGPTLTRQCKLSPR